MQKIRDKIIDGVKETLGNIKDGKRLVELELENQMLLQENKKLKGMLEEVREHLALLASQATIYVKQIKKVNTKRE
jgi:predicted  nucleic acid-binding Zn-ribbon protein